MTNRAKRASFLLLIFMWSGWALTHSVGAGAEEAVSTPMSIASGIEAAQGTSALPPSQASYEKREKLHTTHSEGGLPLFWIIAIAINLLLFGLFILWAIGQWRSHDR
tara:strand:- start:844 stop:1164 length:321 start_codon:yes stop_codon:yes gene_type:complete